MQTVEAAGPQKLTADRRRRWWVALATIVLVVGVGLSAVGALMWRSDTEHRDRHRHVEHRLRGDIIIPALFDRKRSATHTALHFGFLVMCAKQSSERFHLLPGNLVDKRFTPAFERSIASDFIKKSC